MILRDEVLIVPGFNSMSECMVHQTNKQTSRFPHETKLSINKFLFHGTLFRISEEYYRYPVSEHESKDNTCRNSVKFG